jgi:hypothetical protein
MTKSYYVASTRISPKIADLVEYGHHIVLEDITYERINIVNSLCKNNKDKERVINHLLENEKLFDKII